jgi:hypothetical protein
MPLPLGGGAGGCRAAHRIHGPCAQNLTGKNFCLETSFSLFGEEERTKEKPRYISTAVYSYSTIAITGK